MEKRAQHEYVMIEVYFSYAGKLRSPLATQKTGVIFRKIFFISQKQRIYTQPKIRLNIHALFIYFSIGDFNGIEDTPRTA